MNKQRIWQQMEEQRLKCSRCGTCRSVCQVFREEKTEDTIPRGKARMLEAVATKDIALTPAMQERFSKCLLCMRCKKACASDVKTDIMFLAARTLAAEKNGLPLVKKLAFTGLKYRQLFDLGLRTGALFQNLIFKELPDGRGKVARIPLPAAGLNLRRVIPSLTTRPLRSRLPYLNKAQGHQSKGRVLFFTGCSLNYMYPEAGEALVRVLVKNGWDVVIPPEQCCCGTPVFTSGDIEGGQFLAEHNVKTISNTAYDMIVTGCASCGNSLKHEYEFVLQDSPLLDKWKELSDKVYDISTFVVKYGDLSKLQAVPLKVTYHDPCHLVRGMGVSQEPREILKAIPQLEFIEMKGADECCGAGGTFSASYYELARKINDEKIANAQATGAEYLVTGCSVCKMHITDGFVRHNSNMKVLHTAELLDQAYGTAERGGRL